MPRFKHYNYDQHSMVVINYQQQLQPGTFEHAIHYLIDQKLDLTIFYPRYCNESGGRPAYDPAILLKIILFAYSKGITSSRQIQWCCETNILFKALSCDSVPHFTTIANFVSSHAGEIEHLFEQILLICSEQGLLGNELFAIDGCKIPSNAAKEHSGTLKELTAKRKKLRKLIRYHLKEQEKHDRVMSGSEVTEEEMDQVIRRSKTVKALDKAADRIDDFLKKTPGPRMGQGKRPQEVKSNLTDNESAKMTTSKGTIQGYNGVAAVDKKHQIIVDAQAFGEGQEHHTLVPVLEQIKDRYQRLNLSPDIYQEGAIVTADTGFANEANMKYLHENRIDGYIADNRFRSRDPRFNEQKTKYGKRHAGGSKRSETIPASEFDFDPVKLTCRCPADQMLTFNGTRMDAYGNPKANFSGRLLQCRNCALKDRCMHNSASADHRKGSGRQVSFILEAKRLPNYTDWMKHRVDSAKGKEIYGHRMSVVEPVFGNITSSKGLNRFSLRGKRKVQSQWQMFCMVHNIEKIVNYGNLSF